MSTIHRLVKNKFVVSFFLILLLASFLRFYNFDNRWGLAYDQARDVIVAREALRTYSIPLIGPFASAGQFVYGPQWFWILMFFVVIYPYSIITPWIIQTFLYILVVLVMVIIGKDLGGKWFGIIVGFFTAISTAQISHATNLTSPSMVGIFSFISLYFFIRYIKTGSTISAILMAFMIGNAVNIHFQAIGLLFLIPISFIFDKAKSLKRIGVLLLGVLIPLIPLIYFDITNNFFESRNWMDYFLYGQYKIYIPNRWLTYVGMYWPNSWSKIIGGEAIFGYIIIFLVGAGIFVEILKRNISKSILALIISLACIFVMLRYYRGERIDSNLVFLHPFILILTGWIFLKIYKFNRILGLILFFATTVATLRVDIAHIKNAENLTAIQTTEWRKKIETQFPKDKFKVYDFKHKNPHKSFPLVLFLDEKGKIDNNGRRIGFNIDNSRIKLPYRSIWGSKGGYQIFDLNSSTSAQLVKDEWAMINPSQIYHSTVEWYIER